MEQLKQEPIKSEEKQPLIIVYPPDFIFKYRRASRITPAQEVVSVREQVTFQLVGIKYPSIYYNKADEFFTRFNLKREWFKYPVKFEGGKIYVFQDYKPLTEEERKMGGQLACFKDCPYPFKGHPFPQAIFELDKAKRVVKQLFELFVNKKLWPMMVAYALMTHRKKVEVTEHFLDSMAGAIWKSIETYIPEKEFMNKYGQEVYKFIVNFFTRWGVKKDVAERFAENFTPLFDGDNAYWMKLGDIMSITTKEMILKDPRKEILRLAEVFVEREFFNPQLAQRVGKLAKAASFLLFFPRIRRVFKECIEASDFENFQFDDGDNYHCLVYNDYNYLGLPVEKRLEMYKQYHIIHPPLPVRLTITG